MSTNLMTLPTSSVQGMTSREIAELTGKEHKNVLRDIDNLLKSLGSDLSAGFSMGYEGDPAHGYRFFVLDRDSTYCLVAGYDASARMRIIKRWQELETKQIEAGPANLLDAATNMVALAKLFGLTGNHALLSADRATATLTGVSPMKLLGATHLVSSVQEPLLTVTELGQMVGLSAVATNKKLLAAGLQTAKRDMHGDLAYTPTDAGRAYGVFLDTNKKHGDGTPVQQVKWYASTAKLLEEPKKEQPC